MKLDLNIPTRWAKEDWDYLDIVAKSIGLSRSEFIRYFSISAAKILKNGVLQVDRVEFSGAKILNWDESSIRDHQIIAKSLGMTHEEFIKQGEQQEIERISRLVFNPYFVRELNNSPQNTRTSSFSS